MVNVRRVSSDTNTKHLSLMINMKKKGTDLTYALS